MLISPPSSILPFVRIQRLQNGWTHVYNIWHCGILQEAVTSFHPSSGTNRTYSLNEDLTRISEQLSRGHKGLPIILRRKSKESPDCV